MKISSLAVVLLVGMSLTPSLAGAGPPAGKKIRVLVVPPAAVHAKIAQERLELLGFEVAVTTIDGLGADSMTRYDVLFLPTAWAQTADWFGKYQEKAPTFLAFVEKGGGLVVGQPNPYMLPGKVCTPMLLPFPVTFHALYKDEDKQRINLSHQHFITEDLGVDELPHPTDRILKIDREHYQVLVLGAHSESASLAVVEHGKGRAVVLTGNEGKTSIHPFSDKLFQRIFVWAARREPERFRKKKP